MVAIGSVPGSGRGPAMEAPDPPAMVGGVKQERAGGSPARQPLVSTFRRRAAGLVQHGLRFRRGRPRAAGRGPAGRRPRAEPRSPSADQGRRRARGARTTRGFLNRYIFSLLLRGRVEIGGRAVAAVIACSSRALAAACGGGRLGFDVRGCGLGHRKHHRADRAGTGRVDQRRNRAEPNEAAPSEPGESTSAGESGARVAAAPATVAGNPTVVAAPRAEAAARTRAATGVAVGGRLVEAGLQGVSDPPGRSDLQAGA